ncbi:hypothetical protein ACKVMT_03895 [Halobacteriales archaeon Cl-PHB]
MASDTVTVTLEAGDDSDELEVPTALLDMLGEGGDSTPQIVGDIAMLGLAQQAHGVVHHGHGETSPELEAAEEKTMDLFEERFGQSYGEVTGHSH